MFHMPMSSPMMTTMLGFVCASADAAVNSKVASAAMPEWNHLCRLIS